MDKYETRRLNLLTLIREHCGGKAAALADKIGRSPSYVSRMLYVEGKEGKKRIGEDMRDIIESALVLERGRLDDEYAAIKERDGIVDVSTVQQPTQPYLVSDSDPAAAIQLGTSPLSLEQLRQLIPGGRAFRPLTPEGPGVTHIPKVKLKLSAGISGIEVIPERFDGSTTMLSTDWIQRHGYDPAQLISTFVGGESMLPNLHPDDVVVVNLADRDPVDGKVFAVNYEGEPVIKRLTRDLGRWWLTSDNPDQQRYPRKACEGDTCIIVGRVVHKESEHI